MSWRRCCCGGGSVISGSSDCRICNGTLPDEITVTFAGIVNDGPFGGCAGGVSCGDVFNKSFVLTKLTGCSYRLEDDACDPGGDNFVIQVEFIALTASTFIVTVALQQMSGLSALFTMTWSVPEQPCPPTDMEATLGANVGDFCQSDGSPITITL